MKRFSAQYIFTNSGPVLKRGIITAEDDGTIINVENTGGDLYEKEATEFYNGIIIPGFVNCHCHLELSDMKGLIQPGKGLPDFILNIRKYRDFNKERKTDALLSSDGSLYREGIVLCADICNTDITFDFKKQSSIKYINLLEVFGIDPVKADKRFGEIILLSQRADSAGIEYWLVPHSVYSLSLPLFRLLKKSTSLNRVTSLHFMETGAEITFLKNHAGPLRESYEKSGLYTEKPETVKNHASAVLEEITPSGNLILVHNTFADNLTIQKVSTRKNLFWCLCPGSNLYIENHLPPVDLLTSEGCEIVIGTDSLASNNKLSILEELKLLQQYFPHILLDNLIRWATINGARALCEESTFGSIERGKKPGLLLLEDIDLMKMKLTPHTRIKRLI